MRQLGVRRGKSVTRSERDGEGDQLSPWPVSHLEALRGAGDAQCGEDVLSHMLRGGGGDGGDGDVGELGLRMCMCVVGEVARGNGARGRDSSAATPIQGCHLPLYLLLLLLLFPG